MCVCVWICIWISVRVSACVCACVCLSVCVSVSEFECRPEVRVMPSLAGATVSLRNLSMLRLLTSTYKGTQTQAHTYAHANRHNHDSTIRLLCQTSSSVIPNKNSLIKCMLSYGGIITSLQYRLISSTYCSSRLLISSLLTFLHTRTNIH